MDWKPDDKKVEKLRGTVVPTEWGVNDEVTVVSIITEDNNEYVVSESRMVRRLMKHMDEMVEVDGFLGEDEYGEQVLVVGDFSVLSLEDDEDFDEDEDEEDEEEDELDEDFEDDEDDEDEEDFESYSLRRRSSNARRPPQHGTW